jgi:hypothetical protein
MPKAPQASDSSSPVTSVASFGLGFPESKVLCCAGKSACVSRALGEEQDEEEEEEGQALDGAHAQKQSGISCCHLVYGALYTLEFTLVSAHNTWHAPSTTISLSLIPRCRVPSPALALEPSALSPPTPFCSPATNSQKSVFCYISIQNSLNRGLLRIEPPVAGAFASSLLLWAADRAAYATSTPCAASIASTAPNAEARSSRDRSSMAIEPHTEGCICLPIPCAFCHTPALKDRM